MSYKNKALRYHSMGRKGKIEVLPSKPCAVCGRPMSWRRAWAKNWESVRYCSQACRLRKGRAEVGHD